MPVHDRGKVLVHAMLMLAGGGESCADIEFLGSQGRLFGEVCSDSTLYRTFTDTLDTQAVGRARGAVGKVRSRVWARSGSTTGTAPVILDLDASLVEIHSENKEGTAESPWESWRLLALETRMESWENNRHRGSRRHVGTHLRRKAQAVRLVRQLRKELATSQGTVKRVAEQLGYGVESVRTWVKQDEINRGEAAGTTSADQARIKELVQENKELRRVNEILKRASAFFAAELDRPHKR